MSNSSTSSAPIVFEWLERIGLGYAVPYFKEKGIVSPKALTSLTIKDYEELHVSDLSDRKRLYELVQRVRMASRSVKQRSSEEKETVAQQTKTGGQTSAAAVASTAAASTASTATAAATSKKNSSPTKKSHKSQQPNPSNNTRNNASNSGGGNSSAREVVRKQRAKDRIRRLTKSPSKPGKPSKPKPKPNKEQGNHHTPVTTNHSHNKPRSSPQRYKQRSDSKDEDEAELAMASPLVPLGGGGNNAHHHYPEEKDDHGRNRNHNKDNKDDNTEEDVDLLGSSQAGNAFAILGLRKEQVDNAKIKVVVRKRPLSRKEKAREDVDIVDMNEHSQVYLHEPRVKVDMTRYVETHEFSFDDAYDEQQDNSKIYESTCRPLLCSVFERNATATCFAYGQTGSGKTHTMMGPDKGNDGTRSEKGLYEMAAEDIFRLLKSARFKHIGAYVSFFEIYGGRLYDLLNDRRKLRCMEDRLKQVQIVGLRSEKILNIHDLFELMDTGHRARSTGTTGANIDSSRSHAILQIKLIDTRINKPTGGKFSFIDLAGSERGADTTHNNRQTRMEGAEINKSLLALKECIRGLFHVQHHIPFRGSKLTQVLKDSFVGGNSHTVMVVTISPNLTNAEHTLNTLRYGYRVKEIKSDDGGGGRRKKGLDLNRDYNSKNDPVRRSAPNFSSNGGQQRDRSSGRHARVQHLQRPMTAGSNKDNTPPGGGGDRMSRNQLRKQRREHRTTPPNRASMPTHPTSSSSSSSPSPSFTNNSNSNPPAPQAPTTTPNLEVPTLNNRNNHLPESTPSPDAIPIPAQRRSTSTKSREQQQQQRQPSNIPKLKPKMIKKKLNMTPKQTNAPTPPYRGGSVKTVDVDAGPLGIESLNGGEEGDNNNSINEEDEIIIQEMEEEHADLVTEIFTDEETLVAGHREQIHEMMNLVKEEMTALDEVEAPGSVIDDYVDKLENILAKKSAIIANLQQQLEEFKIKLEAEESLSASIGSSRNNSPAAKAQIRGFTDE